MLPPHKRWGGSKVFLITAIILVLSDFLDAQAPPVPCPEYFQYITNNYGTAGRITLYNQPVQNIRVEAAFSQTRRLGNYYGALSLVNDLQTTYQILQNSNQISYYVDFPNTSIYPKLTSITVNGQQICRGGGDGPYSSTFQLSHTFTPITNTYAVQPNNFFQVSNNPFLSQAMNRAKISSTNIFLSQMPKPINQRPILQDNTYTFPSSTSITRPSINRGPPTQVFTNNPQNVGSSNGFSVSSGNPWLSMANNQPQPPAKPKPVVVPIISSNTTESTNGFENLNRFNQITLANREYRCGKDGLAQFIYKGIFLEQGEFPWLTAIYVNKPEIKFRCGGSLITQRTVITAAHCAEDANGDFSKYFVTVGRHDLSSVDPRGSDVRDVGFIAINPEFNREKLPDADIALFHLSAPVVFSSVLKPVCLWTDSTDDRMIVGKNGTVAGWGEYEGGRFSPKPKKLDVLITDRDTCRERHINEQSAITRRTICAGNGDGSGICNGDSGGGLLIFVGGVWYLRGIVSGGTPIKGTKECDLLGFGFYTDVAYHKKWIQENIRY